MANFLQVTKNIDQFFCFLMYQTNNRAVLNGGDLIENWILFCNIQIEVIL